MYNIKNIINKLFNKKDVTKKSPWFLYYKRQKKQWITSLLLLLHFSISLFALSSILFWYPIEFTVLLNCAKDGKGVVGVKNWGKLSVK